MRTVAYIDGFNLYYGALKHSAYKWLDMKAFIQRFAKTGYNDLTAIKYFTASVSPRPHDPSQHIRQGTFFRALQTLPELSIIKGHFLSHAVYMPEVDANNALTGRMVKVLKTEEKGSDVNLASHLLLDAMHDQFDVAVLVSNDSDLLTPVKFIRRYFNKKVMYVNPHKIPSRVLKNNCDYYYQVKKGDLKNSQFPQSLQDRDGVFYKPQGW